MTEQVTWKAIGGPQPCYECGRSLKVTEIFECRTTIVGKRQFTVVWGFCCLPTKRTRKVEWQPAGSSPVQKEREQRNRK